MIWSVTKILKIMKIVKDHVGRTGSDETCLTMCHFDPEIVTFREFVDYVLGCVNEWGEIQIYESYSAEKGFGKRVFMCEYTYGSLLGTPKSLLEEKGDTRVRLISTVSGWSNCSYYLVLATS